MTSGWVEMPSMLMPVLARSTVERGREAASIPSGTEIRKRRMAPPSTTAPVTAPARRTCGSTGVPDELATVKPPRCCRNVRPRSPCSARQTKRPYWS